MFCRCCCRYAEGSPTAEAYCAATITLLSRRVDIYYAACHADADLLLAAFRFHGDAACVAADAAADMPLLRAAAFFFSLIFFYDAETRPRCCLIDIEHYAAAATPSPRFCAFRHFRRHTCQRRHDAMPPPRVAWRYVLPLCHAVFRVPCFAAFIRFAFDYFSTDHRTGQKNTGDIHNMPLLSLYATRLFRFADFAAYALPLVLPPCATCHTPFSFAFRCRVCHINIETFFAASCFSLYAFAMIAFFISLLRHGHAATLFAYFAIFRRHCATRRLR